MDVEQEQQGYRAASGGLPLSFYIRSARLCLKKATLARLQPNAENGGTDEELQHLRRFEALVACALPAHKEYCERRGDKAVRELHVGLVEARRRIQELLESGEAVRSPRKPGSPRKTSPKKVGSPKKSGSPRKASSPRKPGSPKKAVSRPASRPKAVPEKLSSKSPRTPVLRSTIQAPKRIRTTAKRSESPVKRRPASPRKKTEVSEKHESPKSRKLKEHEREQQQRRELSRQQQLESDNEASFMKVTKKRTKGAEAKDWEAKLYDVYTFADEKPPVYYLPKKLPTALRNRKTPGSSESRSTTPAKPAPGVRDSTRSLPTEKLDDQRNRSDLFDLRRSYDDLGARQGRVKLYDDAEEYCGRRIEEREPVLHRDGKTQGLRRSLLERLERKKLDKVWDNLVYENKKLEECLGSPGFAKSPGKPVHDDVSDSRSVLDDENKTGSVKFLVRDMRGSLDGLRIRLEEEGKRWRGRVNSLEKEIEFLRDETEADVVSLRRHAQEEVKKREAFSQKWSGSLDSLEEDFAKDIDSLRAEVAKKGDTSWMESVIKETVEKCLSNRPELKEKEKSLKDELRLLKTEVELLSKGRIELESHVEQLAQIVENDRESMGTEQMNVRTENGYIRKQLQSLKKESLQGRVEADEFRKGCESDMEDMKRVLSKLKDETVQMKIDMQSLRSLEETYKTDRGSLLRRSADRIRDETSQEKMMIMDRVENLSKLYLGGLDEVRMDVLDVKVKCQDKLEELEDQVRDIKQKQESIPCSRSSSRGAPSAEDLESRMAHIESKQELMHMAGLEESRMAIFNLDMKCQDKIEAIEQQLKEVRRRSNESPAVSRATSRDLMIEDLDSRIQVLERKQDSHRYFFDDAIAAAEKEKRLAVVAASDATSAASKAESALAEVMRVVDSESRSSRYSRRTKLETERDTLTSASNELRRTSIDLSRETESAVAAAEEAKRKAEDLQKQLKDAVHEVDRQRNMAAEFAAKASSVSSEAKDLLEEMAGMRRSLLENGSSDGIDSDRSHETIKLLSELEKRMNVLEQSSKLKEEKLGEKDKQVKTQTLAKGKISTTTRKRLENEELKLDTRVTNLENHLEHVASATYSNIRMLDKKVEHVSISTQSALEGAATAEKKCGALGAELVKVFRVLASFKKDNATAAEKPKESVKAKDSSPARRPHFACESCKKAASTFLSRSLELLPSKDLKRVNVRTSSTDESKSSVTASRDQQLEPESPFAEREESECAVHGKRTMSTQERIAKVEESIGLVPSTRRSWGTSVATLLTEESQKSNLEEDVQAWGINARGIRVMQEES